MNKETELMNISSMNDLRAILDAIKIVSKFNKIKIEGSLRMMDQIMKCIREESLDIGFIFDSDIYTKGSHNMELGFNFGVTEYKSMQQGEIEIVVNEDEIFKITILE